MRIKKIRQTQGAIASVADVYTTDNNATYNAPYVNSIIESGNNENGTYIKYKDGIMICYRTIEKTIDITTSWVNNYVGEDRTEYNFAQSFISPPNLQKTIHCVGLVSFLPFEYRNMTITNSSFKDYAIFRPNSATGAKVRLDILAIGKWK